MFIYLIAENATEMSIKLPSGRIVILTQEIDYETNNKEELDFFSSLSYIGITPNKSKKYKRFIGDKLEAIPRASIIKDWDKDYLDSFRIASKKEREIFDNIYSHTNKYDENKEIPNYYERKSLEGHI